MSRAHRLVRGFTLIEMLVVLVILGLVAGLVIAHGPSGSPVLDLRASAGEVAQALRQARAQAIATNQTTRFVLDLAARRWRVDAGAPHALSPALALGSTTVSGETGRQVAAISFAPDGSSSGGQVDMTEGARRATIGVDWLTGRVSIAYGS